MMDVFNLSAPWGRFSIGELQGTVQRHENPVRVNEASNDSASCQEARRYTNPTPTQHILHDPQILEKKDVNMSLDSETYLSLQYKCNTTNSYCVPNNKQWWPSVACEHMAIS